MFSYSLLEEENKCFPTVYLRKKKLYTYSLLEEKQNLYQQSGQDKCILTHYIWRDMSHLVEKPTMWFPNRSDTNRPLQLQKLARNLKFWI